VLEPKLVEEYRPAPEELVPMQWGVATESVKEPAKSSVRQLAPAEPDFGFA
jgi:hypothetical protein